MRDNIPVIRIGDKQADVVGGHHIIQNTKTLALPGLIQPLKIRMPIL
jgi:hypothetical protein